MSHFLINKPTSKADEKINIKVIDVPKNKEINLTATTSDYYCINAKPNIGYGTTWQSKVTYKSDNNGNIDLSINKAISGDYRGVSDMGIFYTMKPINIVKPVLTKKLAEIPLYENFHIQIIATCEGVQLCETMIKRVYMSDKVSFKNIQKENLVGRYFVEKTKQKVPAVIVLSGSDGRIEKAQNIAMLLANHGYATLAVAYFGLNGTKDSLQKIPLEIVKEAIHYLKQQPEIDITKIAIYGRSKGGELALIAASHYSEISCVIANTPCCYVMEGLNKKQRNAKASSWTINQKEFPYIPISKKVLAEYIWKKIIGSPMSLDEMYSKMLTYKKLPDTQIAVEQINGPILLLSAEADEIWPSKRFAEIIFNTLTKQKFYHTIQWENYQYAKHFLTVAYQPNNRYETQNLKAMMNDVADSWEKTLSFLGSFAKGEFK